LICHSKTVSVTLKAAEQLAARGIEAEVIDLAHHPTAGHRGGARIGVRGRTAASSPRKGWPFAGVGAQVVDTIQREAFDELDAPVLR
jgi:pyruvate dehydrogenase E1 component beta subunit